MPDVDIPAHLRKYVVQQNYDAYTARDQAVWRFVVGQTHRALRDAAHAAYAPGFASVGISTQRIPRLSDMNTALAPAGFRVVCVDGFIPPRAFQAFQARGFLPVAADIRTAAHLTYTPAPDIIHEAAGHAPFLAQPDYARFLRRIGAVSERAFESRHDRELYRVIHLLSELKENPESTPEEVAAVEAELGALRQRDVPVSEATRMARLYWWTVEYGLVGSLTDYRLYGAGLLSSIGEAHFSRGPAVKKLPLSAACTGVDYDITQAQPQLFVAADFAELESVLSDVEQTLSHVRGGEAALRAARESEDTATITLDSGISVIGTLASYGHDHLRLSGPCAIAEADACLPFRPLSELVVPLGALAAGPALSALTPRDLGDRTRDGVLELETAAGLRVSGRFLRCHERAGHVRVVELADARIEQGGRPLIAQAAWYPLVLAAHALTASPVVPEGFYATTQFSEVSVPKARALPAREAELTALHARLEAARALPPTDLLPALQALHTRLAGQFPEEWLLRFELLAALTHAGPPGAELSTQLVRELTALERFYGGREPIATALAAWAARR